MNKRGMVGDNKFTQTTMRKILSYDSGFMDRLVYIVENSPFLKGYVQNMVVASKDQSNINNRSEDEDYDN